MMIGYQVGNITDYRKWSLSGTSGILEFQVPEQSETFQCVDLHLSQFKIVFNCCDVIDIHKLFAIITLALELATVQLYNPTVKISLRCQQQFFVIWESGIFE